MNIRFAHCNRIVNTMAEKIAKRTQICNHPKNVPFH